MQRSSSCRLHFMADNRAIQNARGRGVDRRRVLRLSLGAVGAASVLAPMMAQGQYVVRPNPASPTLSPPLPSPVTRNRPPRIDKILFWNETALQLDVLDHSVDAKDARVAGPWLFA